MYSPLCLSTVRATVHSTASKYRYTDLYVHPLYIYLNIGLLIYISPSRSVLIYIAPSACQQVALLHYIASKYRYTDLFASCVCISKYRPTYLRFPLSG